MCERVDCPCCRHGRKVAGDLRLVISTMERYAVRRHALRVLRRRLVERCRAVA